MTRIVSIVENVSPMGLYSRSRKCLDLATVGRGRRASPSSKNPLMSKFNDDPCDLSPNALVLSSSDHDDTTPGSVSSYLPLASVAQTPRTPLSRKFSLDNTRVQIKKSTIGVVQTVKQTPLEVEDSKKGGSIGGIVAHSFYKNSLESEKSSNFDFLRVTSRDSNPKALNNENSEIRNNPGAASKTRIGPILRISNDKGSLRRRSSGGCSRRDRRKRNSIGHSIKKPKFKQKSESLKVKISELPVLSVELPKRKDHSVINLDIEVAKPAPKTHLQSLPATPRSNGISQVKEVSTSGELNITKQTKVKYEVKEGQLVFRATPKAGITPRRSPRKHLSPLKADYFSHKKRKKSPGGVGQKLFSPNSNYLDETIIRSSKNLPSPVKFHDLSQNDTAPDFSNIIDSLGGTDSESSAEKNLVRFGGQEEISVQRDAPITRFSTFPNPVPDVSSAVSTILDDLTDGDSSMDTTDGSNTSGVKTTPISTREEDTSKLFPVFYSNPEEPRSDSSGSIQTKGGKSFVCSSLDVDQAVIDAGQKEIGPTSCGVCGAIYTKGDPEDEASHNKFHNGLLERLRMNGWKQERVVGNFFDGRVIMIKPADAKIWWRKVEEVLQVVDTDLGFSEIGIRKPEVSKVYFFVSDKKIVGFLLAEEIEMGYKMIPNEGKEAVKGYCCSDIGVPVTCGVSRIWVLKDFRRKKIATNLVDCMRSSFYANHYLKEAEFAFSDPTLHGIEFARKYCNNLQFLVYNR